MNLEYIKSYLAICEHKSISKAAEALYVSQPTLTYRMNKLEDYLGLRLFTRSWKGIHLTHEGMLFLPHALHLINRLEKIKVLPEYSHRIMNRSILHRCGPESTNYRIGINHHLIYYAEKFLPSLGKTFPDLDIDIMAGTSKELMEKLRYGLLDYIIYYCFDSPVPNTTVLDQESLIVILNEADYKLVKNDLLLIKEINKPLFINENPAQIEYLPLFNKIKKYLNEPNIRVISNSRLISILVQANQGYSIMPKSIYLNNVKDLQSNIIRKMQLNFRIPIYSSFNPVNEGQQKIAAFLNKIIVGKKKISS